MSVFSPVLMEFRLCRLVHSSFKVFLKLFIVLVPLKVFMVMIQVSIGEKVIKDFSFVHYFEEELLVKIWK